jgi:hypothetical protein
MRSGRDQQNRAPGASCFLEAALPGGEPLDAGNGSFGLRVLGWRLGLIGSWGFSPWVAGARAGTTGTPKQAVRELSGLLLGEHRLHLPEKLVGLLPVRRAHPVSVQLSSSCPVVQLAHRLMMFFENLVGLLLLLIVQVEILDGSIEGFSTASGRASRTGRRLSAEESAEEDQGDGHQGRGLPMSERTAGHEGISSESSEPRTQ